MMVKGNAQDYRDRAHQQASFSRQMQHRYEQGPVLVCNAGECINAAK